MTNRQTFECDQCGACCKAFIVEAQYLDILREPRIQELKPDLRMADAVDKWWNRAIVLYDIETRQCPFLSECDGKHSCQIYPTRPNQCVALEPGDAKCQQARVMRSLPLLLDSEGRYPDRNQLAESCGDYELDFAEFFEECYE